MQTLHYIMFVQLPERYSQVCKYCFTKIKCHQINPNISEGFDPKINILFIFFFIPPIYNSDNQGSIADIYNLILIYKKSHLFVQEISF